VLLAHTDSAGRRRRGHRLSVGGRCYTKLGRRHPRKDKRVSFPLPKVSASCSAPASCIRPSLCRPSESLLAAVQHSPAPRPFFGCVAEFPHRDSPSRSAPPPTDLAASLRLVEAKRASPSLASHPFTSHPHSHPPPKPSPPGLAVDDEQSFVTTGT
jgi:hypothetical protein